MQDSTNIPETEASNSPETDTQETGNALDQVAALLAGEEPEDNLEETSQGSESSPETDAKGKPKTLADLAETLGLEVKDLYEIAVPFDTGNNEAETRTLGEIKDAISDRDSFEVDRLTWEEDRQKAEAKILRSNQELQELVSMLPRSALSQDLLEKVARKRARLMETEEKLTRDAIPTWVDDQVETRDREAMSEHLADYGFPANYLDQVIDHRTLKYIRDNMLRQKRIERALEQVKTVKRPGHSPSKPTEKTQTKRPVSRGPKSRVRNQVDQVAELLKTG